MRFKLGRRHGSVIAKVWIALLAIGLAIWSFFFVFVLVGLVIGLVKYHHWGWGYAMSGNSRVRCVVQRGEKTNCTK